MLLYKIPGATSFIELKTHKDQVYHLYRATARAMGPLSDGNEWSATQKTDIYHKQQEARVQNQPVPSEISNETFGHCLLDMNDILVNNRFDLKEIFPLLTKLMILNECRLMKVNGLSKLLFVAVPSGTGKTYCINALLNVFRRNYNIAIAVASSGTAALLLKD
ncbi:hypothetical protein INT46_003501, partial [Mucor plumbeus]